MSHVLGDHISAVALLWEMSPCDSGALFGQALPSRLPSVPTSETLYSKVSFFPFTPSLRVRMNPM